ncbi:hypothetical protein D9757_012147 [Collybiopsis confluens]|uniref:Uncharacterized protein n=1 Tax=Collybiopsis confluens TaxID=2823264 RepID=A0A8H5G7Z3_9AGAR|nr:hypothetical protein D9757_012147 [Collybiopsis confluens]
MWSGVIEVYAAALYNFATFREMAGDKATARSLFRDGLEQARSIGMSETIMEEVSSALRRLDMEQKREKEQGLHETLILVASASVPSLRRNKEHNNVPPSDTNVASAVYSLVFVVLDENVTVIRKGAYGKPLHSDTISKFEVGPQYRVTVYLEQKVADWGYRGKQLLPCLLMDLCIQDPLYETGPCLRRDLNLNHMDSDAPTTTLLDLDAASGSLDEESSTAERDRERIAQADLDAIFGSLDDPLTDIEEDVVPRKRRRGGLGCSKCYPGNVMKVVFCMALRTGRGYLSLKLSKNKTPATHELPNIRRKFQDQLRAPSHTTLWAEGNISRRAMSEDGFDLVYHLPGGVGPKTLVLMTDLLIKFGKDLKVKVTPTADKYHRNSPNTYVHRKGEVAGVVHLVRCWHGIGRTDLDMVPSRDFIKSGKAFSKSMELLNELRFFSFGINSFLKTIDPTQYKSLQDARNKGHAQYPFLKMIDTVDPLLMEGRAIMWNRITPDHKDSRDPLVAWAALVVLGRIKSGFLFFRQLNLKVRYQAGDVVWLRGAILDHEVDVWDGEQRICVAHFTHQSYFADLGCECLTAPGVTPTEPPVPSSEEVPPAGGGKSKRRRVSCNIPGGSSV